MSFFHACRGQTFSPKWHFSILHSPGHLLSSIQAFSYLPPHTHSMFFFPYLYFLPHQSPNLCTLIPNHPVTSTQHAQTIAFCHTAQSQQCRQCPNSLTVPDLISGL